MCMRYLCIGISYILFICLYFQCSVCNHRFLTLDNLERHKELKHTVSPGNLVLRDLSTYNQLSLQ